MFPISNRCCRSLVTVLIAFVPVLQGSSAGPTAAASSQRRTPAIVVFGDSLTSGPGLKRNETYPALLQQRITEKGYHYRVINAGVSGNTTTRALRRLDRALVSDTAILIVALGINDGLRGVPVATVERNLTTIIDRAQSRKIQVLLCEMVAPPIHGFRYTEEFHGMFGRLATRYRLPVVPFFLSNVFGDPDLNGSDGIHPNAAGHKLIAEAVWTSLELLLARGR
jgi:acyl-CoA thioesterase I